MARFAIGVVLTFVAVKAGAALTIHSHGSEQMVTGNAIVLNCSGKFKIVTAYHTLENSMRDAGGQISLTFNGLKFDVPAQTSVHRHFHDDVAVISPLNGIKESLFDVLSQSSYPLDWKASKCIANDCDQQRELLEKVVVMSKNDGVLIDNTPGLLGEFGVSTSILNPDIGGKFAINSQLTIPASSGSPVLDETGKYLVGMVSSHLKDQNGGFTNVTLAISSTDFADLCHLDDSNWLFISTGSVKSTIYEHGASGRDPYSLTAEDQAALGERQPGQTD